MTHDARIARYIEFIQQLDRGEYGAELAADSDDEIGQLGQALCGLARTLVGRERERRSLEQITLHMNAGLLLDDILENVYRDFRGVIPYNRIGLALIEDDGKIVRSHWDKSELPFIRLEKGYAAPLAGSSLERIIATEQPRILNDLEAYLAAKPESKSTRLILSEGIRSSLTCPLISNSVPVGFIFFSSVQPYAYADVHVDIFKRIAEQLSAIVEKGRLTTELAAQKSASERQNEELHRLNKLKNTFLGMAAHDLRNPLGLIQTGTQLLLDPDSDLSEEQHRTLYGTMERQTHHMLALLNDLLNVTEIESGSLELEPQPTDLRVFLREAVRLRAELSESKGTQVILETVPEGKVVADPDRLNQVVDNLLSNAVKYSPPGSTVRVSAQRIESGWRVNVQDEGPGITEEDRKRLFQDFARLSARPTGGEKSIGLGLAIVRRVTEAHGGQVGVDSEPGHGATFWFTLPDRE